MRGGRWIVPTDPCAMHEHHRGPGPPIELPLESDPQDHARHACGAHPPSLMRQPAVLHSMPEQERVRVELLGAHIAGQTAGVLQ
jgi:hypothetical protein